MNPPSTAKASRREFLVGGLLVGSAAATGLIAHAAAPSETPAPDLGRAVPEQIGGWRHQPASALLIPQGEVENEKVYDQLVSRHYAGDPLPPVMLLIAYGREQGGTSQLHRPELCYPAAGFRMTEHADVPVPVPGGGTLNARHLAGSAPGRTEQILYWTRVGREFPATSMAQRWSVLRQTVQSGVPDGVLVRLSTILPDPDQGVALLQRFALDLVNASQAPLRQLLWNRA